MTDKLPCLGLNTQSRISLVLFDVSAVLWGQGEIPAESPVKFGAAFQFGLCQAGLLPAAAWTS